MEYTDQLRRFDRKIDDRHAIRLADEIAPMAAANHRPDVWKRCLACIDLTSLGSGDTRSQIAGLTEKVVAFGNHFPHLPNVASLCVFPGFVETVGLAAGNSRLTITSVAGGFPTSQTYLEVKMLETAMALENGADEIDLVINLGQILEGEYDPAGSEINLLKAEIGDEGVLKVIIETGLLRDSDLIRRTALLAMIAGADFVKTSTGKGVEGVTPEAAVVVCEAIRDYFEATGRRVGFKASGGVAQASDAVLYYTIVERILGAEWLGPNLFRIGSSSLANNLLSAIEGKTIEYF